MPVQPRRVVKLEPSRELCGTTLVEFGDLVVRLAPFAEDRKRRREDREGRRRAPGAGQKGAPFWLRLLVALTHLRQGLPCRATARLFNVHERSVRNWRDEIEELLAEHGCQPPGVAEPIRNYEDLARYLDTLETGVVMVDGTDVPRSSPKKWEQQKAAWSFKSKGHVVKGTVIADGGRRPLFFEGNPSGEGRTHDITMLRAQSQLLAVLIASMVTVMADKGYSGLGQDIDPARLELPVKRGKRRGISDEDQERNRAHSSKRIVVEHAIGRMKWWGAMRHWRRHPTKFNRTGKAVATLASIL